MAKHGTPSLAVLPEVLKQVQTEHGAGPALDLDVKLLGNFETVSAIIIINIRGEALVLSIRQFCTPGCRTGERAAHYHC